MTEPETSSEEAQTEQAVAQAEPAGNDNLDGLLNAFSRPSDPSQADEPEELEAGKESPADPESPEVSPDESKIQTERNEGSDLNAAVGDESEGGEAKVEIFDPVSGEYFSVPKSVAGKFENLSKSYGNARSKMNEALGERDRLKIQSDSTASQSQGQTSAQRMESFCKTADEHFSNAINADGAKGMSRAVLSITADAVNPELERIDKRFEELESQLGVVYGAMEEELPSRAIGKVIRIAEQQFGREFTDSQKQRTKQLVLEKYNNHGSQITEALVYGAILEAVTGQESAAKSKIPEPANSAVQGTRLAHSAPAVPSRGSSPAPASGEPAQNAGPLNGAFLNMNDPRTL